MKKQSGFTLIELMVVMAIIAILATAGLTAYSNYLKKARDSARLQTARQILTAVESLANGGPLPTATELTTYLQNEGISYNLPTMNPFIARASGVIDNILGTALAISDPFGPSSGPCLAEPDPGTTGGMQYLYCVFAYTRYSDGTYTIMHGIEHEDTKNNFWAAYHHGQQFYGEVTGTNPYIVAANVGTSSGFTDSNNSMSNSGQVKSIGEQIESIQGLGVGYFIDGIGTGGILSPYTTT